jgi:hypothetical protein
MRATGNQLVTALKIQVMKEPKTVVGKMDTKNEAETAPPW